MTSCDGSWRLACTCTEVRVSRPAAMRPVGGTSDGFPSNRSSYWQGADFGFSGTFAECQLTCANCEPIGAIPMFRSQGSGESGSLHVRASDIEKRWAV